jgi:hypothetical protein
MRISLFGVGIFKVYVANDPIRKTRKEQVSGAAIYRLDQLTRLSLGVIAFQ